MKKKRPVDVIFQKGIPMRKKQYAPVPAGWYSSMIPTPGEYYRCGTCDVESATVSERGGSCLRCRLEQRRAARGQQQDDLSPA